MGVRDGVALEIVEACLGFEDPAERDTEIAVRTGGDAALEKRVRSLLERADKPFRLLATEHFGAATRAPLTIPPRIGPFRVVRVIGEGGMGSVVRAERDDGVYDQVVAIKLIRADLADRVMRDRFDAERRILARLDHPGIAHVVDGGEVDGHPWLAMEYIDGSPVTVALDAAKADRNVRIEAFLSVCEAIAFAHRNLVVHADIKPSNALLRRDGAIKLVDFGIARLIVDLDTNESGTPYPLTRGYAAPERGEGAAPTIAGDVYSLGVLFHELLTGALPGEGSAAKTPLDPDLDAIIARARSTDPGARYPEVAALVADIVAWRDHFPVAARGNTSAVYRAAKFLRRHRAGAIVTSGIIALLAAASVISTTLYVRAERARTQAEARFMDVRALARFMLFDLYDQLASAPGTVEARIKLASKARLYLDQLRAVPDAPIDLRLDSAMGYRRLAMVQGVTGVSSLGDMAAARHSLDLAQGVLEGILRDDPNNALALTERGWLDANRWTLGSDTNEAAVINDRSARWFSRALALDPTSSSAAIGHLTTEKNRGYDLIWIRNRPKDAAKILTPALLKLRATVVPEGWRDEARRLEFTILSCLGDAAYYNDDVAGAVVYYREAEQIAAAEIRRRETPSWLAAYAQAEWNVGGSLTEDRAAIAKVRAGREAIERALSYGRDASAEKLLLVLLGEEANRLLATGDAEKALAASSRSITLREDRAARSPGDVLPARDVAIALPAHSDVLAAAGQAIAACAAARRSADILERLHVQGKLGARDISVDIPKAAKAVAAHCR